MPRKTSSAASAPSGVTTRSGRHASQEITEAFQGTGLRPSLRTHESATRGLQANQGATAQQVDIRPTYRTSPAEGGTLRTAGDSVLETGETIQMEQRPRASGNFPPPGPEGIKGPATTGAAPVGTWATFTNLPSEHSTLPEAQGAGPSNPTTAGPPPPTPSSREPVRPSGAPAQVGQETFPRDRIREICATEDSAIVSRLEAQLAELVQRQQLGEQRFAALEATTEDVRVIRGDVNRLLEGRSAPTQAPTPPIAPVDRYDHGEPSRKPTVREAGGTTDHRGDTSNQEDVYSDDEGRERRRRKKKKKGRSSQKKRKSRKNKRKGSYSSSSESSDSDRSTSSESSSSSDESQDGDEFHDAPRPRGPRYKGLKELRPPNPAFDRLLSYRTYRLRNRRQKRSGKETGKVRDHLKRLGLTMKDASFNGDDPILVLEFLTRFADEADTLEMSEAQAFVALPYFLKGQAATLYRSTKSASSRRGGVSVYPEAVQYLLRTYATPSAIREAVQTVRSMAQKPNEGELTYGMRLSKASNRCGNVFPEYEKINLFIDGLDPSIRTLVARYREETPRDELSYERLVQVAQDEGDSHRARTGASKLRPTTGTSLLRSQDQARSVGPSKPRSGSQALLAESSVEFRHGPSAAGSDQHDGTGDLHLFHEGSSQPTSELPSTAAYEDSISSDPVMALGRPRHIPAPRIAFQEHSPQVALNRPGWQDRNASARRQDPRDRATQMRPPAICHQCYAHGHISPDCVVPMRYYLKVITNYENLPETDKVRVPTTAYTQAKVLLAHETAKREAAMTSESTPAPVAQVAERHPSILRRSPPDSGSQQEN